MGNSLIGLYRMAEESNITVLCEDSADTCSMSVMTLSGDCYIGINPFLIHSSAEEKVCLAHEIGHCKTGSFYNLYSPFDIREKHEHRATVSAIKSIFSKDDILCALKSGCNNRYDLACYFSVTEDFMQQALDYYFAK